MNDLKQAAQQALEALKCLVETYEMGNTIRADIVDAEEAITALKAALEQPEQAEPVAWRFQSPLSEEGQWEYGKEPPVGSRWAIEPLYTHPPRREWRSFSEGALMGLYIDFDRKKDKKRSDVEYLMRFLDVVQTKLKELNT
jgi:hypothetical protein